MLKTFSILAVFLTLSIATGWQLNVRAREAEVSSAPYGFQVGQRAPEFDLLVVGEGHSLRLAHLQGKPVIVNFFCGCNFCSIVGREWVKNKGNVGDAAVIAIMSNHWTYAPDAVRNFRKMTGWEGPVLADMQSRITTRYNALTCPRVFAIDRQGIIRYASAEGASDEKQIIADALAAVKGR